jgi:anti-repressor protein
MSESIVQFNFEGKEVRTIEDTEGELWFVAKDVCVALGLSYGGHNLDKLDEDEKGMVNLPSLGGMQSFRVVNESGGYALVFGSSREKAKKFRRWVTSEVLPTIRKTGSYTVQKPLTDDQLLAKAFLIASAKVKQLEADNKAKKEALIKANQTIQNQKEVIIEQKPAVEFTNTVLSSVNNLDVGEVAKHLGTIGPNQLMRLLREKNWVYLKQGANVPFQDKIDSGLLELATRATKWRDGTTHIYGVTVITPKGLVAVEKLVRDVKKL